MQTPAIPCAVACLALAVPLPEQSWEDATLVVEQQRAPGYYLCHYTTLGGHQFSMLVDRPCSLSVMVHPETGQVREKQAADAGATH